MTPKEKAEELVARYAIKSYQLKLGISFDFDKQCALIAVDEMLGLCWNGNEIALNYWQQVKNEIEKL